MFVMFVPTANVALETQWSGVDVIFNVAGSYNGLQQPYFVLTIVNVPTT